MSATQQCPVCFGPLEVRRVEPCFVCGGWPGVEPSKPDHYFTIRGDGTPMMLCNICWLEEVLCDQGDLKRRLKISGEADLVVTAERPVPGQDKFCPTCNRRLVLLEAMAHRLSEEELPGLATMNWGANRRLSVQNLHLVWTQVRHNPQPGGQLCAVA